MPVRMCRRSSPASPTTWTSGVSVTLPRPRPEILVELLQLAVGAAQPFFGASPRLLSSSPCQSCCRRRCQAGSVVETEPSVSKLRSRHTQEARRLVGRHCSLEVLASLSLSLRSPKFFHLPTPSSRFSSLFLLI